MLAVTGCGQAHVGPDAGERIDAAADAGLADAGPPDASPLDAALPDAGVDAGPPVDARAYTFCVEMRELRCRGTRDCCGLTGRVDFLNPRTQCGAYIEVQCGAWARDTALRDGTLRWNEAEAQRLLDTLSAALETCSAISRPFDWSAIFEGTLAEGEDCTPDLPLAQSVGRFRCRGDLRCALTGYLEGIFSGTCAPRGDEGDSCNFDCQAGLWCNSTLNEPDDAFTGLCAREERTRYCNRDLWCMTAFCARRSGECVEPEPAHTWCGFTG